MRTQFFHCDICKIEIEGKMAVFVFNDTLINKDLQTVPVSKQADFCDGCAQYIINAIDDLAKKVEAKNKEK